MRWIVLAGWVACSSAWAGVGGVELARDGAGNQWFFTKRHAALAGTLAARLDVRFQRIRAFLQHEHVQQASLSIHYSCKQRRVDVDQVQLLGGAGEELFHAQDMDGLHDVSRVLPEPILRRLWDHGCPPER